MSLQDPETIDEWKDYIESLSGEELRSKALAANSWTFVKELQGTRLSPQEINEVLWLFAKQFLVTGQMPPSDGYINLNRLAATCPTLKPLYLAMK